MFKINSDIFKLFFLSVSGWTWCLAGRISSSPRETLTFRGALVCLRTSATTKEFPLTIFQMLLPTTSLVSIWLKRTFRNPYFYFTREQLHLSLFNITRFFTTTISMRHVIYNIHALTQTKHDLQIYGPLWNKVFKINV